MMPMVHQIQRLMLVVDRNVSFWKCGWEGVYRVALLSRVVWKVSWGGGWEDGPGDFLRMVLTPDVVVPPWFV